VARSRLGLGMLRWAAFACALGLLAIGSAAAAEPGVTVTLRPGLDRSHVETVLGAARQAGAPVTLRWEDEPSPAAASPAAPPAPPQTVWQAFETGLARHVDGLSELGSISEAAAAAWHGAVGLHLVRLLVVAAVAGGVVGLLLGRRAGTAGGRWRRAWRGLVRDGVALAVFLATAALLLRLLPDAAPARPLAAALLRSAALAGIAFALGRFLLSPADASARLLPLRRPRWHMAMLVALVLLGLALDLAAVLAREGGAAPAGLAAWTLLGTTLTTVLTLVWLWLGRRDLVALVRGEAGEEGSVLRRVLAAALTPALAATVLAAWVVALLVVADPGYDTWAAAVAATRVAFLALPLLALAGDHLLRRLAAHRLADSPPVTRAAAVAARAAIAGGIWVAGLALLARAWEPVVVDPRLRHAGGSAVEIGASLVLGWSLWCFLRSYFQAQIPHVSGHGPAEDDDGPAVSSRLSTVLPIVRDLAFGVVMAVTALIVLSAAGINIGPMLAGFGVLGLALSFGSQALVRDIVSGIFFMADDAFRIGEYIDTGKLKGTVERITLRSVQLRHQNGPIHTVPFGTISQITNYSRDWSTVKFLIRLDHAADLEKARRTIKKIGQEMQADPDFGPEFLLPLKMQGVHEIADTAVVIRCKFTVRPAKPSVVQREALRRIYRGLQMAGVPLASNAVLVRSGTAELPGDALERAAAAAQAAQVAQAAAAANPPAAA
jgi:small-conductance mechanosensitive channel